MRERVTASSSAAVRIDSRWKGVGSWGSSISSSSFLEVADAPLSEASGSWGAFSEDDMGESSCARRASCLFLVGFFRFQLEEEVPVAPNGNLASLLGRGDICSSWHIL